MQEKTRQRFIIDRVLLDITFSMCSASGINLHTSRRDTGFLAAKYVLLELKSSK